MEIHHVFATIEDIELKDATVYADRCGSEYDPEKYPLVLDDTYRDKLSKSGLRLLCNPVFTPTLGDPIHVVPNCPIPTQDIRNNYQVKRGYDTGVCNVFSPIYRHDYSYSKCYNLFFVNREHNIVAMVFQMPTETTENARIRCLNCIPERLRTLPYTEICHPIMEFTLYISKHSPSYRNLLLGTSTKPCIVYTGLKLNRIQLTVDLLKMVHQAGIKQNSSDNLENFKLLLSSLQQCNWKDYPGTIGMLFDIAEGHTRSVAAYCNRYCSTLPKALKEFYSRDSCNFLNEEDLRLGAEFLDYMFEIKDGKFVSVSDLFDKITRNGVSIKQFETVYKTIVKITKRIQ